MKTTRTANEIAAEYRSLVDERDTVRSEDKRIGRRLAELDGEVKAWCEAEGLESLPGEGITLSLRDYDGVEIDDWEAAIAWAIDHGMTNAIQKRVTAGRIREAVEAGVPLPACLNLTTHRRVTMRRSN